MLKVSFNKDFLLGMVNCFLKEFSYFIYIAEFITINFIYHIHFSFNVHIIFNDVISVIFDRDNLFISLLD